MAMKIVSVTARNGASNASFNGLRERLLGLADFIYRGVTDVVVIGAGAVGSVTAAAMGLVLGTAVPPNRISVTFAVVLTPLIFTGATFYPWASLGGLKWFQIVTLLNPLTYVSEGMRASLTALPHLGSGWIALGLAAVAFVCGLIYFLGHVNKEEEIHITQ